MMFKLLQTTLEHVASILSALFALAPVSGIYLHLFNGHSFVHPELFLVACAWMCLCDAVITLMKERMSQVSLVVLGFTLLSLLSYSAEIMTWCVVICTCRLLAAASDKDSHSLLSLLTPPLALWLHTHLKYSWLQLITCVGICVLLSGVSIALYNMATTDDENHHELLDKDVPTERTALLAVNMQQHTKKKFLNNNNNNNSDAIHARILLLTPRSMMFFIFISVNAATMIAYDCLWPGRHFITDEHTSSVTVIVWAVVGLVASQHAVSLLSMGHASLVTAHILLALSWCFVMPWWLGAHHVTWLGIELELFWWHFLTGWCISLCTFELGSLKTCSNYIIVQQVMVTSISLTLLLVSGIFYALLNDNNTEAMMMTMFACSVICGLIYSAVLYNGYKWRYSTPPAVLFPFPIAFAQLHQSMKADTKQTLATDV